MVGRGGHLAAFISCGTVAAGRRSGEGPGDIFPRNNKQGHSPDKGSWMPAVW